MIRAGTRPVADTLRAAADRIDALPAPPEPQILTLDALEAWADAHNVGVSEVTPGHFYACTVVAGVVEVRMAYGRVAVSHG
jgi:hypothetical protein